MLSEDDERAASPMMIDPALVSTNTANEVQKSSQKERSVLLVRA